MGLTTAEATQRAWDANVAAVQEAKQAVGDALVAYGAAGDAASRVLAPLRRKMFTGRLTDTEADVVDVEEAKVEAARLAVEDAKRRLEDAGRQFKAGVTAKQIAAVKKSGG